MDTDYILVTDREGADLTEIDLDDDGSLAVETLQSQFGGAVMGLRFRNPATGNFRAVKVRNGVLFPPRGGWGERNYFVTKSDAASQPIPPTRQPEGTNIRSEFEEVKVCHAIKNALLLIQYMQGGYSTDSIPILGPGLREIDTLRKCC